MTIFVFADNASSTLASGILAADTTLTVQSGDGALYPSISAGQAAIVALEDSSGNIEIVHATNLTGDVLTVVRAQEGTTAQDFASGSRVELRVTAGLLQALLQKNGGDTLSGTTEVTGVIDLGSGGSVQNGEFTGKLRSGPGVTAGQIFVSAGSPKSGSDTILTSGNVPGALPGNLGMVVSGMVLLWSGLVGSIPAGYTLCDGTNSTPDLRDKFVVGGGGALPTSGGASSVNTSTDTTGASGGAHVLTTSELPAHTHDIKYITFGVQGGSQLVTGQPLGTGGLTGATQPAGSAAGHTHPLTDPGHHHSVATLPPYRALFYIMKT